MLLLAVVSGNGSGVRWGSGGKRRGKEKGERPRWRERRVTAACGWPAVRGGGHREEM